MHFHIPEALANNLVYDAFCPFLCLGGRKFSGDCCCTITKGRKKCRNCKMNMQRKHISLLLLLWLGIFAITCAQHISELWKLCYGTRKTMLYKSDAYFPSYRLCLQTPLNLEKMHMYAANVHLKTLIHVHLQFCLLEAMHTTCTSIFYFCEPFLCVTLIK